MRDDNPRNEKHAAAVVRNGVSGVLSTSRCSAAWQANGETWRKPSRSVALTAVIVGDIALPLETLVFYGSYRSDRKGIRLAQCVCQELRSRGDTAELIDAKALALPMIDRMFKEYAPGEAPQTLQVLADKIRRADAFVFVVGEYNWGVQPGLKNLTDHFLEEWFWRPAAIASYSTGRTAGVRAALAWRSTLSEMGMLVVSSTLAVGLIDEALDDAGQPIGELGRSLARALPRFLDDLAWWGDAGRAQRQRKEPPY
jgi:NAD(P)H-dependent FMN reductase